jgi:hypothetical protein
MPQETNLNVSPYFDDFDQNKNYYKVLFKPGFPVQARELTTLQSILQDQIEKFGDHIFKEGSVVIPGQTNFNAYYNAVELNRDFLGIDVSSYIKSLVGLKIRGESSGIIATIDKVLTSEESERENPTLYVNYLSANVNDNESFFFSDGENLIVDENITTETLSFISGEPFASTISQNSHSFGSAFSVSNGVYYLRGHFVNVSTQTIILDQYTNTPDYKIGFIVSEEIINSFGDETLNDNAKGFSNFTAPGADRLKITASLDKKLLNDDSGENFVEIAQVQRGIIRNRPGDPIYNIINDKFARRTFDESGDYYVNRFNVSCEESLNNNLGNNGIFLKNGRTYQGNSPSDDLAIYEISSGKAYVRGYEVEINAPTFLDVEKPRTTKNTGDESVIYSTGPSLALNRVVGAPVIGIGTNYTLSLRDSRIGEDKNIAAGEEIGLARIFDFALEEGSYNTLFLDSNRWDASLFDIQTYSKITLNQPITLNVPTHIVGNSSGATGFLKESLTDSTSLTLYNVSGNFLTNESFTIDGVRNNRVALAVTNYGISDVKSIFSNDSGTIFNGDTVQSVSYTVGICSISAESQGISTITISGTDYFNTIKPLNILKFTNPLLPNVPNFSKVISVSVGLTTVGVNTSNISTFVEISGITTVTGVCEGKLPESDIPVTDLSSLITNYLPSSNNTLFTPLSKQNVSEVDLSNSNLTIRKNFTVSISSNTTANIPAESNEIFLPYDKERYSLMTSDGTIEPLSADKFNISPDGKNLQIFGLNAENDTGARLIATLRRSNIKSKIKKRSRVSSVIIDKSTLNTSGVGTATIDDGLIFGNFPYGTRVQDKEICLNVPDILKVHGIFESFGTSEPFAPQMTLSNIIGTNSTTSDLIIGEQIIGKTSNAIALVAERNSSNKITFVYLNDANFTANEVVEFKESTASAIISSLESVSKNISNSFTFDNGQRNTFYDYGKLIIKDGISNPQRKIKIYFDHAFYDSQDDGDITTANSYQLFDYKDDITYYEGFRMTDIIDIRPRVSDYTVSAGSRSPFEFDGRLFDQDGNSATNVLAADESIVLNYNFYLPRIDKIFVNKESEFTIQKGIPDENPKAPQMIEDGLEIAEVFLPPYLYDTNKASIQTREYKRYRMSDISKLETRIKNLEYYTTLSLLESETANLNILDSNGLNRFKSGFFVDNFDSLTTQEERIGIRNSIDPFLSELRPSHYTNSVDLVVATKSRLGVGITSNEDITNLETNDLIGSNIKKSGDIITLNYTNVEYIKQPYATRVENVQPYVLVFWEGSLILNPSSDIWIDTVRLEPKTIQMEGNYLSTIQTLQETQGLNPQTGLGPVIWGSWSLLGFGNPRWVDARGKGQGGNSESIAVHNRFMQSRGGLKLGKGDPKWIGGSGKFIADGTIPTRGRYVQVVDALYGRSGTQLQVRERFDTESLGDSVVSVDIQPFMRSRNIEFVSHNLKPNARLYAFFDGRDVTNLCFPKLLEINMQSGTFVVGETVDIQRPSTTTSLVLEGSFRVAQLRHKKGKFNAPSQIYRQNPYVSGQTIPQSYSSTSSLLNVDTASMAVNSQGSFYGLIRPDYLLVGRTSGAIARVNQVRLVSDNTGDMVGSFFIPDPNSNSNLRFAAGIRNFVLTSDQNNNPIPGSGGTAAEKNYFAEGKTQNIQETIISIRNADVSTRRLTQTRTEEEFSGLYIDPLAQSFACDESTGVYLTKLDVYFQQKDSSIPVSCQIRTMDLGFPTQTVLPFSEVTVDADDVIITDDASVPTTFEFESPVYLEGNQEYAIVLLSPSTSYFVWISSLIGRSSEGQDDSFSPPIDTLTGERITTQPILGSLFKSQNASTWTPSQFEDLKFTLHRAEFSTSPGTITFYNPDLTPGNNQVPLLTRNPLDFISRKIRVGLSNTITENDENFPIGTTVIQQISNASAIYSGKVGIATGTTLDGGISIDNPGIGYEPISGTLTYNNIPLQNVLSRGRNGTANITIKDGIATQVEIVNGGYGYEIGDVLTVSQLGDTNLGRNLRISIARIDEFNELILDNVKGEFNIGVGLGNTIRFINASGNLVDLNSGSGGNITISNPIDIESDGLHFRVRHLNHGMHSPLNYVRISGASSDIEPSTITQDIGNNFSGSLNITNITNFETFEGLPVSELNPGYALIEGEILKYTSVSSNSINIISRGVNNTNAISHTNGSQILKYELNGVSLLRINKLHRLEDATIDNPIGLDYYSIRIDRSSFNDGNLVITDRRPSTGLSPALYFNSSKFDGGSEIRASQNMQFEVLTPLIETFTPSQTNVSAQVRTVSGTSISGNESSFIDKGFSSISLGKFNYFENPRLICSTDNEHQLLSGLSANKSFNAILTLTSNDSRLTPCIDLTRASIITTTNRVNRITRSEEYATDVRVKSLTTNQNAFLYATKQIRLQNPATSIKLYVTADINDYADIRALYSIDNNENADPIFELFPGFNNLNNLTEVINPELSDGRPDRFIEKTSILDFEGGNFSEYEFTVNNLPSFGYYRIKLIMTSTNQSYVPKLKDIRAIALA